MTPEETLREKLAAKEAECEALRQQLAGAKQHLVRACSANLGALDCLTVALDAPGSAPIVGKFSKLSARELEIARRIGGGACAKDVASQLSVSPHTVRNHLKSVYRKLGISRQAELVVWFSKAEAPA